MLESWERAGPEVSTWIHVPVTLTSLLMMPELEKEVRLESQGQLLDEEDGKRTRFGLELGPA